MRSGGAATLGIGEVRSGLQAFARRQAQRIGGLVMIALTFVAIAALATWNVADPSFSYAADNPITNAIGFPGAAFADLAMQFFGLGALFLVLPMLAWGYWLYRGELPGRTGQRALAWLAGAILAAGVFSCYPRGATWPLPNGLGGVFGDVVLKLPGLVLGGYPTGLAAAIIGLVLCGPAIWLLAYGCGAIRRVEAEAQPAPRRRARTAPAMDAEDDDFEEDVAGGGFAFAGAVTHWWLSFRAAIDRASARHPRSAERTAVHREPVFEGRAPSPADDIFDLNVNDPVDRRMIEDDDMPGFDDFDADDDFDGDIHPGARATGPLVEKPAPAPKPGNRVVREAQRSLIPNGAFEMPELHFLAEPKNVVKDSSLSKDALEQNARLLEGVLEDFGVKGEIIHVRPGPVVTLYELEPAPGIKSSRVIGLADDIARSMSAIAARVAVVPGRNAIGIELPNATRETVYLRELLASRDFETTKAKLALSLGKTINGEAVIADLAKMPHLLVAGTTGSGKSVAINTMILSILYRMTPDQCRLIMIDPKMLELSV